MNSTPAGDRSAMIGQLVLLYPRQSMQTVNTQ